MGLTGVAITDHDCVSSYVRAQKYLAQKKKDNPDNEAWQKFKLILGNEIYLCRNGMNKENYIKGEDRYFHFILLAKDEIGNQQIREISTRAWQQSYMFFHRRVPTYYSDLEEIIGKNPGHVIASSACLGSWIDTHILAAEAFGKKDPVVFDEYYKGINMWIDKIVSIFGEGNFFLELQPGVTKEQRYVNKKLLELGEKRGIDCIVTTDSHYLMHEDRPIHAAYLNSKEGDREVDDFYEAAYMMSKDELWERMGDYISEDRFNKLLYNTNKIADMCEDYTIMKKLKLPYQPRKVLDVAKPTQLFIENSPHLMTFLNSDDPADKQLATKLHNYLLSGGHSEEELINKIKRVDYELGIIWDSSEKQNVRWSKYLLQMEDYIDIFWNEGNSLICPSRGSAGASYVMYLLGIIQIDPTREKAPLLFERFMNPERASVLDVDIDVESTKRNNCITALQDTYGKDNVVRVSTFKTEKAKSAVLAAARGLGLDIDTARYMASLVGSERGIQYSLMDMYYGNEENELAPNPTFVREMKLHSKLWEVAQRIEGLINGCGIHAGGVIIVDEPFTNSCAIMTTTKGEEISAFDLHDAEEVSLIKIDLLATEGLSKIRTCLDLLVDYDYVKPEETIKQTYEKVIGIYNLDRTNPEMWEMVWNNQIISLFQMEQQSGIQGIALTKPQSLEDLATLNSVMRLMAPERGAEQPLNKYARFRENIYAWEEEMNEYNLTSDEKALLHSLLDYSNGICAQQEDLYNLLTHPKIAGFGLGKADVLRKAVAKKSPVAYKQFEEEYFANMKEKGLSEQLCKYVWNVLVATQRGYSFNLAHTLSYSMVGLQEMNLAYKFPILFWNVANLIIDSGAQLFTEDYEDLENVEVNEDGEVVSDVEDEEKTANTTVNYGKIASAIGKMQSRGITVLPPNINKSRYTFTPDTETNSIMYGLKGIVRVGDNIIEEIIQKRPFSSFQDFQSRVKVNKLQMVSLIKSGAFDEFNDRVEIMNEYMASCADTKKALNLRNANMLIENELIPEELDFEKKVFNFNKYLKNFKNKESNRITLDEVAFDFYQKHFDLDICNFDNGTTIDADTWKKIYDSHMDKIRQYIKKNHDLLLEQLNEKLLNNVKEKYCEGSLARWSMDSLSFYQKEHELDFINMGKYDLVDFQDLPNEPEIDRTFTSKDGKLITMYKLSKICGTVIDRDKAKSLITLLTPRGVVPVKCYGVMPAYDKQISETGNDGKKHVVEKSWFSRGSKIIVQGVRRDETFLAKKYKSSEMQHHFYLITDIKEDGDLVIQEDRREVINE